jgi:hypothetical protein
MLGVSSGVEVLEARATVVTTTGGVYPRRGRSLRYATSAMQACVMKRLTAVGKTLYGLRIRQVA